MLLEDLIKPDSVLCNAHARSKKHCLEILSELLVRLDPEISNEEIFDSLISRERLGCTSLNQGVAFPHCRVPGLKRSVGALVKLSEPVDFDSPDGEPVDLVFGVMVPQEVDEQLQADIDELTTLLNDPALRRRLRDAATSGELYAALISEEAAAVSADLRAAQGS